MDGIGVEICGLGTATTDCETARRETSVTRAAENILLQVTEGYCRAVVLVFRRDVEEDFIPWAVFVSVCSVKFVPQAAKSLEKSHFTIARFVKTTRLHFDRK